MIPIPKIIHTSILQMAVMHQDSKLPINSAHLHTCWTVPLC